MLPAQVQRIRRRLRAAFVPDASPIGDAIARELAEYFGGRLRAFSTPLEPCGTDFQRRVWDRLQAIPFGETRTYAQLATEIGSPNAVRAVGRANGMNALAVVVPCHRVVGSDGRLVGYGGGLWRKQRLLDLEGAAI
jgi:O-6-methylguanine DNA methyltransferase